VLTDDRGVVIAALCAAVSNSLASYFQLPGQSSPAARSRRGRGSRRRATTRNVTPRPPGAYGVTAGLTKVVTGQVQSGGVLEPLQHWPLDTAVVSGVTGVLLTQNALKPGALAVPVAVITVLVMATGVVLLAHQSESASAPTGDQHQHNEPSRT
jgi:predicted anti-sigma-YlaC factor YlaD